MSIMGPQYPYETQIKLDEAWFRHRIQRAIFDFGGDHIGTWSEVQQLVNDIMLSLNHHECDFKC